MPRVLVLRCLTVLVLLAGLTAASTLRAQTPPARMTMGSLVVMRVNGDAGVNESIGAALSHPEPGVRRVAARLVALGRLVSFRPILYDALLTEPDSLVAAEQTRALFLLGASGGIEQLDAYLTSGRAPASAVAAYALELARHTPEAFLERIPRLVQATGASRTTVLSPAIRLLEQQHPAHADATWQAWLAHVPAKTWAGTLQRRGPPASEPALLRAVASADADIRESTIWFVAGWVDADLPVPAAVIDAALTTRDAPTPWETFGRELLMRKLLAAAPVDRSALIADEASRKRADLLAIRRSALLLRTERAAIDLAMGPVTGAGPPQTELDEPPLLRTPENLWPGFLASLAEQTGCRPRGWEFGVVRVTYTVDGRPAALALDRADLSEACGRLALALGHVTLIGPDMPLRPGGIQYLVVPGARDYFSCADAPAANFGEPGDDPDAEAAPGAITQPKKSRHVAPRYPPDAQQRRASGVVVLEADIGREGCLSRAHTLRSVDPILAMEAMRAVLQWRYEPTRVDGRPVAATMTVTVNFDLN